MGIPIDNSAQFSNMAKGSTTNVNSEAMGFSELLNKNKGKSDAGVTMLAGEASLSTDNTVSHLLTNEALTYRENSDTRLPVMGSEEPDLINREVIEKLEILKADKRYIEKKNWFSEVHNSNRSNHLSERKFLDFSDQYVGFAKGNYVHLLQSTGVMNHFKMDSYTQYNHEIVSNEDPKLKYGHLNNLGKNNQYKIQNEGNGIRFSFNEENNGFLIKLGSESSNSIKDNKEKYTHYLLSYRGHPIKEEIAKTFLKTIPGDDQIRVYYRDYRSELIKEALTNLVETLYQPSGKRLVVTYNGATEVFNGGATRR